MLAGKRAMVTGGSGAIGSAIVRIFAGHGADIAFSYRRRKEEAEALADEVRGTGRTVFAGEVEATDASSVDAFCRAADKALRDAVMALDFSAAADLSTAASDAQLDVTKASIDGWTSIQASGILTTDQLTRLLAGPGPGRPRPPGAGNDASPARKR